jgi:hypothetical protein
MIRTCSLFQFRHGDHVCVFYHHKESLREVLTPYISDGLRNGERCFCVQNRDVMQQLVNDLRFLGVDVERVVQQGASFCTRKEKFISQMEVSILLC